MNIYRIGTRSKRERKRIGKAKIDKRSPAVEMIVLNEIDTYGIRS